MKNKICLCTGRTDIKCDETHCDIAAPGAPGDPNQCRICWIRLGRPAVKGGPATVNFRNIERKPCDCNKNTEAKLH